jgi:hypothetical protein
MIDLLEIRLVGNNGILLIRNYVTSYSLSLGIENRSNYSRITTGHCHDLHRDDS